jgi:hypothetical protein
VFCARLCELHGQGRAQAALRSGFGSLGFGHGVDGLFQLTGLSSLGLRVQHGADFIQLGHKHRISLAADGQRAAAVLALHTPACITLPEPGLHGPHCFFLKAFTVSAFVPALLGLALDLAFELGFENQLLFVQRGNQLATAVLKRVFRCHAFNALEIQFCHNAHAPLSFGFMMSRSYNHNKKEESN